MFGLYTQTAGTFYNTGLSSSETISDAFCVSAGQFVTVEYVQDSGTQR